MKQIYTRFDEMIPKEHKFYNYLLRVLNKKIKRKKRVEGEEADGMTKEISMNREKVAIGVPRIGPGPGSEDSWIRWIRV
jgi:hypothetical protein